MAQSPNEQTTGFAFGPKHCSGVCKKQKAEELVVKKLSFKPPEEQSPPLQYWDKAATYKNLYSAVEPTQARQQSTAQIQLEVILLVSRGVVYLLTVNK